MARLSLYFLRMVPTTPPGTTILEVVGREQSLQDDPFRCRASLVPSSLVELRERDNRIPKVFRKVGPCSRLHIARLVAPNSGIRPSLNVSPNLHEYPSKCLRGMEEMSDVQDLSSPSRCDGQPLFQ